MRWNKLENEACSVARTVSVIGDRWTLLILRDCFLRVRRFEEFQARLGQNWSAYHRPSKACAN